MYQHGWRSWKIQGVRDLPSPQGKGTSRHSQDDIISLILSQCSNERPFCQNCIKAGKACEGYERARVFITGTPAGRGRVASHPKRVTPPKKTRAVKEREKEEEEEEGEEKESPRPRHDSAIALEPLTSAWEDNLDLSNTDKGCSTLLTALHTSLHTIRRTEFVDDDVSSFQISLGPYSPPNLLPGLMDGGLWVSAQCLLCHGGVQGGAGSSPESYCVFLFEVRRETHCDDFAANTYQ